MELLRKCKQTSPFKLLSAVPSAMLWIGESAFDMKKESRYHKQETHSVCDICFTCHFAMNE